MNSDTFILSDRYFYIIITFMFILKKKSTPKHNKIIN